MFNISQAKPSTAAIPALFLLSFFLTPSCKDRRIEKTSGFTLNEAFKMEEVLPEELPAYNPVPTRVVGLIHTKLNVEPLFENSTMRGEAYLTMVPHFYKTDSILLDAKSFDILELKVNKGKKALNSKYTYDQEVIKINLGEEISRRDTVHCYIRYLAKPEEGKKEGNNAIVSDKGLFFINPTGKEPFKPKQLWTQGETSYNSRWFPTIESPDQKMTQEISITIDQEMITLSNGLLVSSVAAPNGKRTDTWRQSKPASPYLTMMGAGKFEVIKDKWKDIEVSYYVEPSYARFARKIFGETPSMISFFSEKLGVDYPWEKYSQMVVRDYVSGAMENTTATIMGESLQRTDRELLDENGEDIIAHELFHQWFGDLVTCESWANLPLNESFATYSEYLWLEHRHGRDEAERHRHNDLSTYLGESAQKQVNLFRPHYEKEEDMFDAHSYQKGGLILHYLRKLAGDEAFFESLKLYLTRHAFSSAEVHDLRMAFEDVSGVDYNWFFDQWFFHSGHPVLSFAQRWNDTTKTMELTVSQLQESGNLGLFKLPMDVHLWAGKEKKVQRIVCEQGVQTFYFPCKEKPSLLSVDPEKWVPCQRSYDFTPEEWLRYYELENSYSGKIEALANLSQLSVDDEARDLVLKAFADPAPGVRLGGIHFYESFMGTHKNAYKNALIQLALKDDKSEVRVAALELLSKHFATESWMIKINTEASADRSYMVASSALLRLNEGDPTLAFEMAKRAEADTNINMMKSVAAIYAQTGSDAESQFFIRCIQRITGFEKYDFISLYGKFLLGRSDSIISRGTEILLEIASRNSIWFIRLAAMNELSEIEQMYRNRAREYKLQASNSKTGDTSMQMKADKADAKAADIREKMRDIKVKETDLNLKNIYND